VKDTFYLPPANSLRAYTLSNMTGRALWAMAAPVFFQKRLVLMYKVDYAITSTSSTDVYTDYKSVVSGIPFGAYLMVDSQNHVRRVIISQFYDYNTTVNYPAQLMGGEDNSFNVKSILVHSGKYALGP
jgi:hypothetical protein